MQGLWDDLTGGDLLLDLTNRIATLLDIDPNRLTGPLLELSVSLAIAQIEQFDDTVRTPAKHLAGTGFENRVVNVNVTHADSYHSKPCQPYAARYPAAKLANDWYHVLSSRDAGGLEVPLTVAGPEHPQDPPVGLHRVALLRVSLG